ncbi:MAG: YceI family protein, partial [Bacteroidales bacterium]|nr:YceI family protein [Bacteroidales bacterium]
HDWEMELEKLSCNITVDQDKETLTIQRVVFTAPVKSLKNESSIMNNKTYDALKAEKYPEIKFSLQSSEGVSIKNGTFSGTAEGELTLAGVKKMVNVPFTGKVLPNKTISVTGSKKLSMTEFNIEPPTAFLAHSRQVKL